MRVIEVVEGDKAPIWYSGLTRAITNVPQNAAPGLQWAGVIQNLTQRGVKQAEIDYSGVIPWLKQQPGPVLKSNIVQYLQSREVQVQDHIRGPDRDQIGPDDQAGADHGAAWQQLVQQSQQLQSMKPPFVPEQAYQEWLDKSNAVTQQMDDLHSRMVNDTMQRMGVTGKKTAYDQYKLPGGRDYREMLLTTPPAKRELKLAPPEKKTLYDGGRRPIDNVIEYKFEIGDHEGQITYWPQTYDHMGHAEGPKWKINSSFLQNGTADSLEHAKAWIEQAYNHDKTTHRYDIYRHGHWAGVQNPLAHVRFDTREDKTGEPVLHIAELQSDWHQAGRKHGYRGDPVEINWKPPEMTYAPHTQRNPNRPLTRGYGADGNVIGTVEPLAVGQMMGERAENVWEAWVGQVGSLGHFATEEEAKRAVQDYAINGSRYAVNNKRPPNGPFRKEWPALSVKRIFRYAADHGFNRITWDMGHTQTKRFDLSSQVKKLVYEPKTQTLFAWDKRGSQTIKQVVAPQELPEYIGKDAAMRLMQQPLRNITDARGNTQSVHVLDGQDLKVGGEGMSGFYDQILPMLVNKMVKKYGGRVYQTKVSAPKGRTKFAPAWAVDISPEMKQAVQGGQGLWESIKGRR